MLICKNSKNYKMKEVSEECTSTEGGKFNIQSSSDQFRSRQASVFDQLIALENKHEAVVSQWVDDQPSVKDDTGEETPMEGSSQNLENKSNTVNADQSPFKVPIGLPIKRSAILQPDYKVHPDKWTKYTLADVDDNAVSDSANSEIAHDFLQSRWKCESDYEKQSSNVDSGVAAGGLSFGHFVMPEYVVGTSKGKTSSSLKRKYNDKEVSSSDESSVKGALSFDDQLQCAETADTDNVSDLKLLEETDASEVSSSVFRSVRRRHRNFRKVDEEIKNDDEEND